MRTANMGYKGNRAHRLAARIQHGVDVRAFDDWQAHGLLLIRRRESSSLFTLQCALSEYYGDRTSVYL